MKPANWLITFLAMSLGPAATFAAGNEPELKEVGGELQLAGVPGLAAIVFETQHAGMPGLAGIVIEFAAPNDCNDNGIPDACDAVCGPVGGFCDVPGCGMLPDADNDRIPDECDTCTDMDGDGAGDAGFPNNTCPLDNCPDIPNPSQSDRDGDGFGDATHIVTGIEYACDNCANDYNPDQADSDGDCNGDACECPATPFLPLSCSDVSVVLDPPPCSPAIPCGAGSACSCEPPPPGPPCGRPRQPTHACDSGTNCDPQVDCHFTPDRRPVKVIGTYGALREADPELRARHLAWLDANDDGCVPTDGCFDGVEVNVGCAAASKVPGFASNGIPDGFDWILRQLDGFYCEGWRRFVLYIPAGDLNLEIPQYVASAQYWTLEPWQRSGITTYLKPWIDAHRSFLHPEDDVSIGVYMGFRICDPGALTMDDPRIPNPADPVDMCVFYQNVQPWIDAGFSEIWLDAAAGVDIGNVDVFLQIRNSPNYRNIVKLGAEGIPLAQDCTTGERDPHRCRISRAPFMATQYVLEWGTFGFLGMDRCGCPDPAVECRTFYNAGNPASEQDVLNNMWNLDDPALPPNEIGVWLIPSNDNSLPSITGAKVDKYVDNGFSVWSESEMVDDLLRLSPSLGFGIDFRYQDSCATSVSSLDCDGDGVPNSADNCIVRENPGQEDIDADGRGDACDNCNDADGDGFGHPHIVESACPTDNCPSVPNVLQLDADTDTIGDDCDSCTDTDGDGFGDPGFPANTCPTDNCSNVANVLQLDADSDSIGDDCDSCTDTDGDGFGDPGFSANTCFTDNCPDDRNETQLDYDGDGVGNLCDNCLMDANANQLDTDNDGVGNECELDVVYVDASATGVIDGQSWATAFRLLQQGIGAAEPGDEIWVANGTYTPAPPGNRNASFLLKDRVAIYGGFGGGETDRSQRDPALNETILSGDLLGNDGPNFANNGENCYHVVRANYVNFTAILDGFTISGGNANVSGSLTDYGGGILISNASPTITKCRIVRNAARACGGISCVGSPVLSRLSIEDNVANPGDGGGACFNGPMSTMTLLDSLFSRNSSVRSGGALASAVRDLQSLRTFFDQNQALGDGGGVYFFSGGTATFDDCVFLSNSAPTSNRRGGAVFGSAGAAQSYSMRRCTFIGNQATGGDGGAVAIHTHNGGNAIVQYSRFIGNRAMIRGALRVESSSGGTISITDSEFLGNSTSQGTGALWGFAYSGSQIQVRNVSVHGNNGLGGPGGVRLLSAGQVTLANSIVWGNNSNIPQPEVDIQGLATSNDIRGGFPGGNINVDPLFVNAASGDLRLQPGSPCINAGNNSLLPAGSNIDMDGNVRVSGSPPVVDMGAFEFGAAPGCLDDCDNDGVCDPDEITGATDTDLNNDQVPDSCQGIDCNNNWDAGQTITLYAGGGTDPTVDPVVIATNNSGIDDATICVVRSTRTLHANGGGFRAFGRTATIQTSLAPGQFQLQIKIPFTSLDLSGAAYSTVDLMYYHPAMGNWVLAAEQNTIPSPNSTQVPPGPLGTRRLSTGTPILTSTLGDYGTFYNLGSQRGFVWANVDHTSDYGLAMPFDALFDCNLNGVQDVEDVFNGTSEDCDGNLTPDECESDVDQDGAIDRCDPCPFDSPNDVDGDGQCDSLDNCPTMPNPAQQDCNGNLVGDVCELNLAFGDDDGDGTCNGTDGCPADPNKTEPGDCGCGTSGVDSDNDSVPDCLDQCPAADDRIDNDQNGVSDCAESDSAIPTVSTWGLFVLALSLLVLGKLRFGRHIFDESR